MSKKQHIIRLCSLFFIILSWTFPLSLIPRVPIIKKSMQKHYYQAFISSLHLSPNSKCRFALCFCSSSHLWEHHSIWAFVSSDKILDSSNKTIAFCVLVNHKEDLLFLEVTKVLIVPKHDVMLYTLARAKNALLQLWISSWDNGIQKSNWFQFCKRVWKLRWCEIESNISSLN